MRLIDKSISRNLYESLSNHKKVTRVSKIKLNESDTFKNNVIWSSDQEEEYYSNLTREEMLEICKENGWDELDDGTPIEKATDEELREYITPDYDDMSRDVLEDLEEAIIPEIKKQCEGDILVIFGEAANWHSRGPAAKVIKIDELESFLLPDYDAITRIIVNNNNLGFRQSTHDVPTGFTMYFYSFKDEKSFMRAEEILKRYFDDEYFDMYYFEDYADYKSVEKLVDENLLTPVKNTINGNTGLSESVSINTGTTNVTSDETGVTIEDNGNIITSGNGVTVNIDNESDVSIDSAEVSVDNSEDEANDFDNEPLEPADDLDENASIEFNHIDDVWNELEKCKSVEDMEKLIKNIPNKFGSFDIELSDDGKTAKVTNTYEENGEYNEDIVDISLEDNLDESTTEDEYGTKELARQAFVSLQKDEDKDGHVEYIIMKDGRAVERLEASDDDKAISLFNKKYQKLQDDGLNEAEQTIDIFANPEFDYKITDITTLQPTDAGDVRAIDMDDILVGLDESLTERYGNPDYIKLNSFLTKKGKDYSSAIVDVSWPDCKGYVCTFESSCVDGIYNCIIKETATNKRIEHLCVKTTNPIKAFENAIVDLVNMKKQSLISEHDSILEDVELIHNNSHVEDNNGVTYTDDTRVENNADKTNKLIKNREKLLKKKNKNEDEPDQKNTAGEKVADTQDKITESDSDLVSKLKNLRDEAAGKSRSIDEITRDLINSCSDSGQEDLVYEFGIIPTEEAKENIMSSVSNSDFDNLKSIINGIEDSDSEYLLIDGYGRYINISYDKLESIIEDIINGVSLNEAVEDDSNISSNIEDDNITDDESSLEEDTLSKAKFHRKPKSVEQMMTEEENNLVTNSSSYTVVATKELSESEFEDFSNNLSSSYPWLKELYNVEDNSGVFNCIEVTGGKDYSILVDPSGYDYARYAAINSTPEEVSDESSLENNEVVEDNE